MEQRAEIVNRLQPNSPPTGSVLLPLNYELVPFSCHFELSRTRDIGEGPPYLLSVTFDVEVDSSQQPVTWSQASGPTPSLSAHPSTSTASTISHTTFAATFSASTPNPGLNDSAKAGIGVGVTLGVLSLVIFTAIILWRRKRKGTMQPVDRGQDLDEINFAKSQAGEFGNACGRCCSRNARIAYCRQPLEPRWGVGSSKLTVCWYCTPEK